jgi:hypothetical protein
MRAAVVLVVSVACGGGGKLAQPVGNRAPPPPLPACTEERVAAIAAVLQTRWHRDEPPAVRCVPGRFPTPGFYILADTGDDHRAGVLADDGTTELVAFARRALPDDHAVIACATVDLDGDGVEEIVETLRETRHAGTTEWIEIERITGARLATIRGPYTSVDHDDLGGCAGELRLAGQTIVIEVAHAPGIPPSDCLAAGPHAFALDDNAVVEIDTRITRR